MATRRKTSTLAKVGQTVKEAAKTVADVAEDYVVKPVSKAIGVGAKKKPARTRTATKKPAARKPAARKPAKAKR